MPRGIIVCGANGSGKSTFGRELARALRYRYMDIEDYYFKESAVPYSEPRSREACAALLYRDIENCQNFVLSSVLGDYGDPITRLYDCAVLLSAPLEVRMRRIRQRSLERFGERVCGGGDMYEQAEKSCDFVKSRSVRQIEAAAENLPCPLLRIDGTRPIADNVASVARKYLELTGI